MATDEDYSNFLDRANADPSEGLAKAGSKGKVELKTSDHGITIPPVLESLEAYYISDADEEFVPVGLKLEGKTLPDETTFKKLVNHPDSNAAVRIMDVSEWDPQGEYKNVVDAVRDAGRGSDVRIYRVERDSTRVEYWVLTTEGEALLGVKALAVES